VRRQLKEDRKLDAAHVDAHGALQDMGLSADPDDVAAACLCAAGQLLLPGAREVELVIKIPADLPP
jgi:hypothetical protein